MKQWFSQLVEGIFTMPAAQWMAIGAVLLMAILLLWMRRKALNTRVLAFGALCVALSTLLSYMTLFRMPQGGTITPVSMLPILLYAWCCGVGPGLLSGLAVGLLQLIQGAYIVHPVQFLMDYLLPFALLGLCGLFRKHARLLPLGVVFAALARCVCHVLSGVVFFASYAPLGQSVWIYSIGYNGSFMLIETALCLAVVLIPQVSRTVNKLATRK